MHMHMHMRTATQVSAVANLINVLLDPLLIFTAGMGIAGGCLPPPTHTHTL